VLNLTEIRLHYLPGKIVVLLVEIVKQLTMVAVLAGVSLAETGVDCSGLIYRSKKEQVPVFDEPALTGKILFQLSLGEKVCYVGEKERFAIVDLQRSAALGVLPFQRLVFIRLVDLWPPRESQRGELKGDLVGNAKRYITQLLYGGVPDDALAPYKQFFGENESAISSFGAGASSSERSSKPVSSP